MKKTNWTPWIVGLAFGLSFAVGATTRTATLPSYNPDTDAGKIPVIGSSGYIGWMTATGATGSVNTPTTSVNNDLAGFTGTSGRTLFDTGILYTDVTRGAASATSGDIAMFSGSTGKTLADSGLLVSNVAIGATASSVTANDLVAYAGTGGRQTKDSGIPLANVVLVSRAVQAGTGLTVTNSGLLSADITMSVGPNQLQLAMLPTGVSAMSVLGVTGATGINYSAISAGNDGNVLRRSGSTLGFGAISLSDSTNAVSGVLPIGVGGTSASTATAAFTNLSPLTTKGDLITYSSSPQRLPVGTDGYGLISLSSATNGIAWTYDRLGMPGATGATAGYIGETMSLSRLHSAATGLTNNTAKNIGSTTSITLTAGHWQVSGVCEFIPSGTAVVTYQECSVSKTSGTLPAVDTLGVPTSGEVRIAQAFPTGNTPTASSMMLQIPAYPVAVTGGSTMQLFLLEFSLFSASTQTGAGSLTAVRLW